VNIAIIGSGHVGLVTGACFADLGNRVICMDQDASKVKILKSGKIPFYEPGLAEIVTKNVRHKRLRFSSQIAKAVRFAKIIFISVGTPPKGSGEADLSAVENVAEAIAKHINGYKLIVEKSTVPVETGSQLRKILKSNIQKKISFDVASNPEFLREGAAVQDFFKPDRIVIGVESKAAEKLLRDLYQPFKAPMIVTDIQSAEIIKHASNSFLATKISFINLVSQVCEKAGADVGQVAEGMGSDKRIGSGFLSAGIGYGGACFPKDLQAFVNICEKLKVDSGLLTSVGDINSRQKESFIQKIEQALWNLRGKRLGVLGLSFKPNTDDMRSAPAVDILHRLINEGAKIVAYDPQAIPASKKVIKGIRYGKNAYDVCRGADALLILTEWREFRELDLKQVKRFLKKPIVIDGRNIYDQRTMKKLGFQYYSVGRQTI
jgi:UDPglucose 6-dehydrogenase